MLVLWCPDCGFDLFKADVVGCPPRRSEASKVGGGGGRSTSLTVRVASSGAPGCFAVILPRALQGFPPLCFVFPIFGTWYSSFPAFQQVVFHRALPSFVSPPAVPSCGPLTAAPPPPSVCFLRYGVTPCFIFTLPPTHPGWVWRAAPVELRLLSPVRDNETKLFFFLFNRQTYEGTAQEE